MNTLRDILGAIAFIATIGVGYALADNAGEYAAPTPEEIEADIQTQRADLCNADGWPDDDSSRLAFKRACHAELRHPK
ncbi:hypothetical protein ACIPF8_19145 [Collimonas sp. NPDC087041]|uniref:hypothetical protein n=1 Tax=Collimonas sp. NPDC087041 TaxID=3363960 RepID=UPI0037F8454D